MKSDLKLKYFLPAADPEVSCVFRQSCLLPCQIQLGSDPLIHWYQVSAGDLLVHSYYNGRDQLGQQNQNFQGRTSLILDQISRRNASLLLKEVKIQDEGRYECYTSTSTGYKDSFINLKTEAPVSDIRIHQDGNKITCSSEGIYPQPELTWSTEPPSNTALNETTRIHQTEDQLYDISSSLTGPDNETDLIYSCSIRTRRNQRRTTLTEPASVGFSGSQVTICCSSFNISASSLVWRFNHSQIILTKTDRNIYNVSEDWRKHVRSVSASGSLTLQDLTSDQEGVYSCELSDDEETIITHLYLRRTGENLVVSELVRRTVVCVVVAAAAAGFMRLYKKKMEESEAPQL